MRNEVVTSLIIVGMALFIVFLSIRLTQVRHLNRKANGEITQNILKILREVDRNG